MAEFQGDRKRRKVEASQASIKELLENGEVSLGEVFQQCADGLVQSYQKIDQQLKVGAQQWVEHVKKQKQEMLDQACFDDLVNELKEFYKLDEKRKALEEDVKKSDDKLINSLKSLTEATNTIRSAIDEVKKGIFHEGLQNPDGTPFVPSTEEIPVDEIVAFAERLGHSKAPHGSMFPTNYNKDTCLLYQQPKEYPS